MLSSELKRNSSKQPPDGLPGNDDGGAISSWYIFAALGFYPAIPGMSGFMLGSPQFAQVNLHLGNDHTLQILRTNNDTFCSDLGCPHYVQSVAANGHNWSSPWLDYGAIKDGGALQFLMGEPGNNPWANLMQTHVV